MWRVAVPTGTPERVTELATDISGYLLAPSGDRIAIWADRNMACSDVNCANVTAPGRATAAAAPMTRPSCATGTPGWSLDVRARIFTFARRRPSAGQGHAGGAEPLRRSPSKPFGGAEELAWSPDGRTSISPCARAAALSPIRPISYLSPVPGDASAAPSNLTDANDATDVLPAVAARRPLARLCRDGAADTKPTGRSSSCATSDRPDLGADRGLGPLGQVARAADSRSLYVTAGEVLDTPLFRVDVRTDRATRLTRAGTVSNFVPAATARSSTPQQPAGARRPLPARPPRPLQPAHLGQCRPARRARSGDGRAVQLRRRRRRHGLGQIVKPANATGRLPVAFLIHGGPQARSAAAGPTAGTRGCSQRRAMPP